MKLNIGDKIKYLRRVMFVSEDHGNILLHKPHPQKELKTYQVKQLLEIPEQEGLL